MKFREKGFSFRGFVALADLIFAVSAGLLLLNPIHLEQNAEDSDAQPPEPSVVIEKISRAERDLPSMEQEIRQLQFMTEEYFKNNKS